MKRKITTLALLSIVGLSSVFAQIPTNGLVAYYPFNGNSNDASGNNFNGVVNGATLTTDRFGNANSAYLFNNNYIQISNSGNIDFTNGITFCAWIYTSQYHLGGIVDKMDFTSGFRISTRSSYAESLHNSKIWAQINGYNLGNAAVSTPQYTLNSWQLIVGTYNPADDSLKLYNNGILVGKALINQSISNTNNIVIGRSTPPGVEYFKGVLDDIRIYNRALTQQEINYLNYESPCVNQITTYDTVKVYTPVPSGLVAYYPFNGNANDESGKGNNGIVNGATLTTDRFGKANSAFKFDGINNQISISKINMPSKNVTISLWCKTTKEQQSSVFTNSDYSSSKYINAHVHWSGATTDIYWDYGNIGQQGNGIGRLVIPENISPSFGKLNQWEHFVFESDKSNSKMKVYINGNLAATTLTADTLNSTIIDLLIGGVTSTTGNFHYNGSIDDIKIYNRVLDSTEVKALFTEGACKSSSPPHFQNLAGRGSHTTVRTGT